MLKGLQELLRYADRNSMAHSREVRLPFLSHEVVEFLFSLPSEFKIRNGWTKWIMRQTFKDILPDEITWRKDKIGFEPPQRNWMKNKDIEDKVLFNRNILISNGILHPNLDKHGYKAEDAIHGDNKNWKFLMAGNLYK
jgi:asparagine synthase (glutamine-hydrolysing)